MEKFRIIIQLTRLDKPIGILLLFWPCAWGLTLGYYFNNETILYLKYIIFFFLGSVLMRSAGCIFNDIVDRDLDKKVERTKKRPIASGKISIVESFVYIIFLYVLGLFLPIIMKSKSELIDSSRNKIVLYYNNLINV